MMNIFPNHRYRRIFRSLIYLFSHKRFLTIKSQNDGEESKLLNDLAPYLKVWRYIRKISLDMMGAKLMQKINGPLLKV